MRTGHALVLGAVVLVGCALGSRMLAACATDTTASIVVPDSGTDAQGDAPPLDAAEDGPISNVTTDLLLLSVADFRGQLEPLLDADDAGIPQEYGGLETLATYFAKDRATYPNTLVVATGNSIGATPILSSANGDQATVKALNLLGVGVDILGSHDFDRGLAPLADLLGLATFKIASTNLQNVVQEIGPRPVTPFLLTELGRGDSRVKVAVLGLTNPDITDLQFKANLGSVGVRDLSADGGAPALANGAAANARLLGADVVIALANMGAAPDRNGKLTGPLIDLATNLRGVDVLLGGESDYALATFVGGLFVVQNRNKGRTYARTGIHIDKGRVSITDKSPPIEALARERVRPLCDAGGSCSCLVAPCPDTSYTCSPSTLCERPAVVADKAATLLLDPYRQKLQAVLDTQIGVATAPFARDGVTEQQQETAIGDLASDALLDKYKAQIALVAAGRIVGPLGSPITIGNVQRALVPADEAVVRRVTGHEVWQLLERGVSSLPAASPGFLQIAGIKMTYSLSADAGSRVKTVKLDDGTGADVPPNDSTTYLAVMTQVTSAALDQGALWPGRDLIADILADYVKAKTPLTPPASFTRIVQVP